MVIPIEKISLSVQKSENEKEIDYSIENTDVIVELMNGEIYTAAFFAYRNIENLVRKHKVSGDYLCGKYFYAHKMILVDECSEGNVRDIVEHLIEEGEFYQAFRSL